MENAHQLSNEFNENGFIVVNRPLVSVDLLRKAKERIPRIIEGEYESGIQPKRGQMNLLQRLGQLHVVDKTIHRLLVHSNIGEIAASITGAKKIKIWGTQLFIKPPGSSIQGQVGWHRDSQHITFFKKGLITAWLPLQKMNNRTGTLKYIKGSHKENAFPEPSGAEAQDIQQETNRLKSLLKSDDLWQEVDVLCAEGGLSFHHWETIHGSGSNVSNEHRYGLSIGLATEDLEIAQNEQHFGYLNILANPLFCPVIYDIS